MIMSSAVSHAELNTHWALEQSPRCELKKNEHLYESKGIMLLGPAKRSILPSNILNGLKSDHVRDRTHQSTPGVKFLGLVSGSIVLYSDLGDQPIACVPVRANLLVRMILKIKNC